MVMHTICPRHFFRGESFSRGDKPSPYLRAWSPDESAEITL